MISKYYHGYLTVYLSLMFGVILPLLLALIEGAAAGAGRVQAELVADIGLDSVFAEYNRELLKQYELFLIDDSYGEKEGSLGKIEEHMLEYMSYNMNPTADMPFLLHSNWIKLKNLYLEIEEASFATDDSGEVFKTQAVSFIKDTYGIAFLEEVKNQLSEISERELDSRQIEEELQDKRKAFQEALNKKEIYETGREIQEGISYEKLLDVMDFSREKEILQLVVNDAESISEQAVAREEYISWRSSQGSINKGCGLSASVREEGLVNELLFGEYLLRKCGSYGNIKDNGLLAYQIEYILNGMPSDIENLKASVDRLLSLRVAANFLYLTTQDAVKYKEIKIISEVICGVLTVPELTEMLTFMITAVWSYGESILDVRCLLQGGKVPLIKESKDWKLHLSGLLSGAVWGTEENYSNNTTGMSYQDYLRIFLALMDRQDKIFRSMDVVEMDIRQTPGNKYFRIDQCVDYIKVSFGFRNSREHEYVFTRSMRYDG